MSNTTILIIILAIALVKWIIHLVNKDEDDERDPF